MSRLAGFAAEWMGGAGRDCCAMAAAWVAEVCGFDPDLPRSPELLRGWARDPVAVWRRQLQALAPAEVAGRGDVGIVARAGGLPQGAICLGGGWWMGPGPSGIGMSRPERVLAAWATGYAGG